MTITRRWFAALLSLSMIAVAGDGQGALTLTLPQALELAEQRNPNYLSLLSSDAVAAAEYQVARGTRYPKVQLFASYLYSPSEQKRLIPRTLLKDVAQADKFDHQIATAGASVTLPLYTGGTLIAQREAAQERVDQTQYERLQALDDLRLDVTVAFYRILLMHKVIAANQQGIKELEEAHRVIRVFSLHGKARRLDLLRVETRLTSVRQTLIRSLSMLEITRSQLRRLVAPLNTVSSVRARGTLVFTALPTLDIETLTQESLPRRAAFKAAQAAVELQRFRVKAAVGAGLPQISAQASYRVADGMGNDAPLQDDTVFMLHLSQHLFDGGVIRSRHSRERAQLQRVMNQLSDTRLQIQFEISTSVQSVRETEQRVFNIEAALASSAEALRVEQSKIEAGKGIINDVLLAQADALNAEVDYATALADHHVAVARLQHATGLSPLIQPVHLHEDSP